MSQYYLECISITNGIKIHITNQIGTAYKHYGQALACPFFLLHFYKNFVIILLENLEKVGVCMKKIETFIDILIIIVVGIIVGSIYAAFKFFLG